MSRRSHPSARRLALLAGGELGWWERFRATRHTSGCAACRAELDALRETRMELADLACELPGAVQWDHLAAEMRANIRLGLEAGEIVAPVGAPRAPAPDSEVEFEGYGSFFRPIAVMASVAIFLYCATWMLSTRTKRPGPVASVTVGTTGDGIELKNGATAMTLFHHGGKPVAVEISSGGRERAASLRAQYVDEDTGEVTIHHVYSE